MDVTNLEESPLENREAPCLSIIIPVYNCEKYLSEAVYSILKQPCQNVEVIIVDDGSRDSSGEIADRFAVKYENIQVFHIPNGGVSVARNKGIDHARGKYIGFLDADDVLCKDVYSEEVYATLQSGEFDLLSFSYLKGTDDLRRGSIFSATDGYYPRDHEAYARQAEKHFCSYIYKRDLFSSTIRFPVGIRYHEDVCFLFLIARNARNLMQFSKPWFIYRMNFASVMHQLKSADFVLEEIDAWEWCKKNSAVDKDRSDCEGNIFSYMVEYIRFSCKYGVPAVEIQERVKSCTPFQSAMENYGKFWINKESADVYREFMSNPGNLWVKYRFIGVGQNLCKRLIRTKLGKKINNVLRYRLPLKEYLVEQNIEHEAGIPAADELLFCFCKE